MVQVTTKNPLLVGVDGSVNEAVFDAAVDHTYQTSPAKDAQYVTNPLTDQFVAAGYTPSAAAGKATQFANDLDRLFGEEVAGSVNTSDYSAIENDFRALGASPTDAATDAENTKNVIVVNK